MSSIAFITLGCKLNYAETSSYERALLSHGFSVVSPREKADYYLVNTCSVTEHADKKGRNLISKAARTNPNGHVIVVGCYAELQSEALSAMPGVLRVFRQHEKPSVTEYIIRHSLRHSDAEPEGRSEESIALRHSEANGEESRLLRHSDAKPEGRSEESRVAPDPSVTPFPQDDENVYTPQDDALRHSDAKGEESRLAPDPSVTPFPQDDENVCTTQDDENVYTPQDDALRHSERSKESRLAPDPSVTPFPQDDENVCTPQDDENVCTPQDDALRHSERSEESRVTPDPSVTPFPQDDVFEAYSSGERTRSFLKVQDGCDYFCAYCTVPYARGRSRNIPIATLVRQAKEIASKGIKEIVLTGVNTGDFGKTTGESFLDLLKALNEVDGIERYRISSIEPNLLTDEIIDWIATSTPRKFLPHFHIPLQSGSNTILKQMGRRYTTGFFENKISYIRKRLGNDVFLGIDVIVGFPGETDALFRETVDFLERIRPAFIHIFPYSRRKGTVADEMPNQIEEYIKTYRVNTLEGLCSKLHEEFIQSCAGRRCTVLFEGNTAQSGDGQQLMSGYTDNYIQIVDQYDAAKIGKIVEVVL